MSYVQSKYPELTAKVLDIIKNSPNEHTPETLGLATGLNQFAHLNSSPRMVMWGSHSSQTPVIYGAEPRRIYSGFEEKYGQGTWKTKVKDDALIVKVIPRYPVGPNTFSINPQLNVIYQVKGAVKRFELMTIDRYHSTHQTFGYKNKLVNTEYLTEGAVIPKDTVFAQSPNIRENGNWCMGRDIVVANMSLPEVIEDGVVFREGALDWFTTEQVGKRTGSSGKSYYFLNTYGVGENYKVHPDVGEHIRECGLLFAMRKFDAEHADIDMDVDSLSYDGVDTVLDKCVYAIGGAKIIDVNVMHSHLFRGQTMNCTPVGMDKQIRRYYDSLGRAYRSLLDTEASLRKQNRGSIELSGALERLCVEAEDYHWAANAGALKRTYRATPLDEWNVEVQFAYDYRPAVGSKVSGMHGDKSVICYIWPDERMPVDKWGRRADMISAGGTTIGRMNVGRLVEQYLDSSLWHFERHLRVCADPEREYLEYLAVASPCAYQLVLNFTQAQLTKQVEHAKEYMRLFLPPHSPNLNVALCGELQQRWPVPKDSVTYINESGRICNTIDHVLLGCQHVILSEKTGYDWASVADDVKCQIYGPPAKLSNADKYSYPWRRQTPRGIGEAEERNLIAAVGPVFGARIIEWQNNPDATRMISRTLLTHPTPSNVECLIHDGMVQPGYSRPSLLAKHITACSGVQFSQRKRG